MHSDRPQPQTPAVKVLVGGDSACGVAGFDRGEVQAAGDFLRGSEAAASASSPQLGRFITSPAVRAPLERQRAGVSHAGGEDLERQIAGDRHGFLAADEGSVADDTEAGTRFIGAVDGAPAVRFVLDGDAAGERVAGAHQFPGVSADDELAFKAGGNKDVTARVLPDLNHLFVHDTDGFPGNYAKLPAPIMMQSDVVGMIVDWVVQRLK